MHPTIFPQTIPTSRSAFNPAYSASLQDAALIRGKVRFHQLLTSDNVPYQEKHRQSALQYQASIDNHCKDCNVNTGLQDHIGESCASFPVISCFRCWPYVLVGAWVLHPEPGRRASLSDSGDVGRFDERIPWAAYDGLTRRAARCVPGPDAVDWPQSDLADGTLLFHDKATQKLERL